jgi:SecD/SecF fusion protein
VGLTENVDVADQFPTDLAAAVNANLLQADFVGPAVGADLRRGAFYAVGVALALILLYVSWRFWPTWIVAIAAVVAAVHDVGITLGAIDLLGAEFSIPVLAAMLFVVGYSLNDSIIIADRIRENLRRTRDRSYEEIVDLSVNQTLSRTVMTSGTTLLPVLALLLFGGSVLRDFSITLLIGIGIGTYSSIFILSPLVVWFKGRQREATRTTRRATT